MEISKPLFGRIVRPFRNGREKKHFRFIGHFNGWDVWFDYKLKTLHGTDGYWPNCWAPIDKGFLHKKPDGSLWDLISFAKKYHANKPGLLDAFLKAKSYIQDPSISPNDQTK